MSVVAEEMGVPNRLHDVAPTAKLVYLLLDRYGALRPRNLQMLAGASPDAVRDAIRELRDRDEVMQRPHPDDGRKTRYVLTRQLEVGGGGE